MLSLPDWSRIFQGEANGLLHGDNWNLEFDNSIISEQPQQGWKGYIRSTSARSVVLSYIYPVYISMKN